MPGATETDFFDRADMLDTKVGAGKKDDPADVAKAGFEAMMNGEGRCRHRLAEQAADRNRQHHAGGHAGRTSPQAGRAGHGPTLTQELRTRPMSIVAYRVSPSGEKWLVTRDGEPGMSYVSQEAAYEVAVAEAGGDLRAGHEIRIEVLGSAYDRLGDGSPASIDEGRTQA